MSENTLESPNISSVRAKEVVPSYNEARELAQRAVDDGVVQLVPFEEGQGQYSADVTVYHEVDISEVDPAHLSDYEKEHGFIPKRVDDIVFLEPEKVNHEVAQEFQEKLLDTILQNDGWYLNLDEKDPKLSSRIETGDISEAYELSGPEGRTVAVLNFTETQLTDHQREIVQQITSAISDMSGGGIFKKMKAICFVADTDFDPDAKGVMPFATAHTGTGVLKLSEQILTGAIDEEFFKFKPVFKELGLNPLEAILTHEEAHLLERVDPIFDAFGQATGWSTESMKATDDYGDVQTRSVHTFDPLPHTTWIDKGDGDLTRVRTFDEFGKEAVVAAKPVTRYGARLNAAEDLAEAFVVHTHDVEKDHGKLDPMRRQAIDSMLRRITETTQMSGEVVLTPVLPDEVFKINPMTLTVGETIYRQRKGVVEKKSDFNDPNKWYEKRFTTTVDEYGDEVPVQTRQPRQY